MVSGPLPAKYTAQVASFGNPLDGSDGNNVTRTYNLMLPPDDQRLCEYPEIYANLTKNQTEVIKDLIPKMYSSMPIALMVNVYSCSAERKAQIALQIKENLMSQLELLVIFSPDRKKQGLVTLHPDYPSSNKSFNSIGLIYVPFLTASGLDYRMRVNWSGADPRLLLDDNFKWSFPIQLTNYSAEEGDGLGDAGGRFYDDDDENNGGDTYWFRIVLFSLLVLSPCCRACYLWYAGGGRFYFRRNDGGRIVGIQYIPSRMFVPSGRTNLGVGEGARREGTLTEEQFLSLPEIEYKPISSHYDEDIDESVVENEEQSRESSAKEEPAGIESGKKSTEDKASPSSLNNNNEDNAGDSVPSAANELDIIVTAKLVVIEQADIESGISAPNGQEENISSPVPRNYGEETESQDSVPFSDKTTEMITVAEAADNEVDSSEKQKTGVSAKNEPEKDSCDLVEFLGRDDDPVISMEKGDAIPSAQNGTDGTTMTGFNGGRSDRLDSPSSGEQSMETTETKQHASDKVLLACKSTMCSICIDEFVAGEKIIMLPRCRHGFHRDCIHPWLTERQGCCPFCKAAVFAESESTAEPLEDDEPGEVMTEASSGDENANSTDAPASPSDETITRHNTEFQNGNERNV